MRILIISNYYPPAEIGGWEQLTSDVANELRRRGHEVCILTSNYQANLAEGEEKNVYRALYLESADPLRYHPQFTLLRSWQERQNDKSIADRVKHFGPQIVFINGMWNLSYTVARKAEQLCPGRVVYYLASYWPTEIDAHTAYWTDTSTRSWRRFPKKVMGAFVRRMLLSGEPRNCLDFSQVLCVSTFVQDYLVREAGIPKERTQVVHNGVEIDLFRSPSRAPSRILRLLYAGRLSPDKGAHTLVESLAILRSEAPDLPLEVSIYGKGVPEYESHMKAIAAAHQFESWLQFKGSVPREHMPQVFAEHDVLIFPSIWPEPLARVVQEAMACGLVVIGTTTGGTPELLQDGENGLTFTAEDAQQLATKINLVAKDHNLRSRLAAAARQTVEQHFTLRHMVDQIEGIFTQIVARTEGTVGQA